MLGLWVSDRPGEINLVNIKVGGDLGPLRVDESHGVVDVGLIRIHVDRSPLRRGCPDGHRRVGAGCKQGCTDGMVLVGQHCCWPGQSWSDAGGLCQGRPRCPEGTMALKDNLCARRLPPIPLPADLAPEVTVGGNGKDPAQMVIVPAGAFLRGGSPGGRADSQVGWIGGQKEKLFLREP